MRVNKFIYSLRKSRVLWYTVNSFNLRELYVMTASNSYAFAKGEASFEVGLLPYTLTLEPSESFASRSSEPSAGRKGSYATVLARRFSPPANAEILSPSVLPLSASFTVASYNIGGRLGGNGAHYDRAVAASLGKVMQRREQRETNIRDMETIKRIQELSLKMLFANQEGMDAAAGEWTEAGYNQDPQWYFRNGRATRNQEAVVEYNRIISSYMGERASFRVQDQSVREMLNYQPGSMRALSSSKAMPPSEDDVCKQQIRGIFRDSLRKDIICIQEANWIDHDVFAGSEYNSIFTNLPPSETGSTQPPKNGIAWNRNRFDLIKVIESVAKRAIAVQLRDKENGKIVSVASAHISGCDPFYRNEQVPNPRRAREVTAPSEEEEKTAEVASSSLALDSSITQERQRIYDSTKGDVELRDLLEKLDQESSDVSVIGVDSNVTSLHPRMGILKELGYQLDYTHYLYPTSTNPNCCLDTRIDWIVVKEGNTPAVSVVNIPVDGVRLNDVSTNVSDHRPIASQVFY